MCGGGGVLGIKKSGSDFVLPGNIMSVLLNKPEVVSFYVGTYHVARLGFGKNRKN